MSFSTEHQQMETSLLAFQIQKALQENRRHTTMIVYKKYENVLRYCLMSSSVAVNRVQSRVYSLVLISSNTSYKGHVLEI